MRRSTWQLLLGLALLGAAHPAHAGFGWGGSIGLSLQQNNQWGNGTRVESTVFWFTGGLHLDASFFTPGTLTLGGSANYLGYRASGGSGSDGLNYELHVSALGRTPVRLDASVMRSTTDFTASPNHTQVGTTRVDGVSGGVQVLVADFPIVNATISNVAVSNRSIGSAPVKSETTSLFATAAQSVDWLNYSLQYDTHWTSGDYAETNYQSHNASIRSQFQLESNVSAQAAASYYLRLPTLDSPLDPRMDFQTVSALVQWGPSASVSGGAGYSYTDSLFEAPGSPLRQAISHGVSAYGSRQLNNDLALDLNLSGSSSQARLGTVETRATSESVGSGIRWNRQLTGYAAQATLNGNLGLYQPEVGPNASAWSVSTSGTLWRPIGTWTTSATAAASYDENSGASAGHQLRLYGALSAMGTPFGWYLTSLLTGGYTRTETTAFGGTRNLNVRLDVQANHSGYNLGLNAGVTDDLAEVLIPGAPPAGALIPVDFNTRSRYAMATATIPTFSNLYLSLAGRYVAVTSPGRETNWEAGLSLSASYYLGAFQFSLYDQVSTGGATSTGIGTQNLVFFSASRSFGR